MKRYLKEGYEVEWYCEGKLKKRIKIGGTGDPERDELMQEVSFVDKAVFGRLHYNKLVSEYEGYQDYYNEMADQFKLACRLHGIEGIIKKGTVKEVNSGIQTI